MKCDGTHEACLNKVIVRTRDQIWLMGTTREEFRTIHPSRMPLQSETRNRGAKIPYLWKEVSSDRYHNSWIELK